MINLFSIPVSQYTLNHDTNKMADYCYEYSRINTTNTRSNRGGYQSTNIIGVPVFNVLFFDICKKANLFLQECGSIKEENTLTIDYSWFNINYPGGSNLPHNHPTADISGVYYIKIPVNSGHLYFSNPNPVGYEWTNRDDIFNINTNTIAADSWEFVGQENLLILFPGWAAHGVGGNASKDNRISISFNMSIKKSGDLDSKYKRKASENSEIL